MFLSSRKCATDAVAETPLLTVCWDDDVGLCVRATLACGQGEVIEHFQGEIGPHISQHSLQVRPGLHISDTRHIGYLTHGCDPNCRLDMARFELVTLRAVAAGEILTIDYATTEDRLYRQFACVCGASGCRRWITGRNENATLDGQRLLAASHDATMVA